jgi:hypothetical protein
VTLHFIPHQFMFSRVFSSGFATLFLMFGAHWANSQARQEVKSEFSRSQVTALYQRTLDDYSLLNPDGSTTRVQLNGVVGEYSYRHYYPFEIIGRVSYGQGQLLNQHLTSFTAGAGYTRQFYRRYFPFGRITAGMARTSSTQDQYLFHSANTGLDIALAGGLDIDLTRKYGLRVGEFQNQYLPFGVHNLGSVYWSFGAGAYYHFGK